MATISENISRINKAKTDIKNAIIAKGGSVADDDKIDTYASAVEALPSGGGTELPQNLSRFVTDDWGNPKKITIKGSATKISDNTYKNGKLEDVIIGNGVTTIGNSAFNNCLSLTGITIPDSVTYIGDSAFNECSRLTTVTIPDSVTSIGESAFFDCRNLTNVVIGNGVTSIGDSAFSECRSIETIVIPDSVTTIGFFAFYDCKSLTSITIKAATPPSLRGGFAMVDSIPVIYVPSDSVDAYKSASGWSEYASKIQPIQE